MASNENVFCLNNKLNTINESLADSFRKSFSDCLDNLNNQKGDAGLHLESTQFKAKRGLDGISINLQAGFVVQITNNSKKLYINICYNNYVQLPRKNFVEDYEKQCEWTLSYFLSQLKDGYDGFSQSCICDVVFHPIVSEMNHIYQSNIAFKCLEKHFNIHLDNTNAKFLDLEYIGNADKLLNNYVQGFVVHKSGSIIHLYERLLIVNDPPCRQNKTCSRHQCRLSVQQLYNTNIRKEAFCMITFHLPLLQNITLDVTDRSLCILSQFPFDSNLNISLPYSIKEDCTNCAMKNKPQHLIITLPINIYSFNSIVTSASFICDDSGIDSDIGSPEHKYNRIYNTIDLIKNFFDSNISYMFPSFNVSSSDDVLMFALNIKNVKKDSLFYTYIKNYLSLKCYSENNTNEMTHYAFYMKVNFDISNIQTEIWDNTVTVQFKVNHLLPLENNSVSTTDNRGCGNNAVASDYQYNSNSKRTKNGAQNKNKSVIRNTLIANKVRSISESSEDAALVKRNVTIKGILKCTSMSRSISESSVDDHFGFTMSLDRDFNSSFEFTSTSLDPCIEHNSSTEGMNKKTVRFKDVVAKQVFRFVILLAFDCF